MNIENNGRISSVSGKKQLLIGLFGLAVLSSGFYLAYGQAEAATSESQWGGKLLKSVFAKRIADLPELPPQEVFLTLAKDSSATPQALQTAVSTYRSKSGNDLELTLIGAIHIADPEYYSELNNEFTRYDTVLYELVADKDTRPTREAKPATNLLSMMYQGLGDLLAVQYQMEGIDYQQKNLVHADLSMENLVAEGKRRGETKFTIFAGIALDMLRKTNQNQQAASGGSNQKTAKEQTFQEVIDQLLDPMRMRVDFAKEFTKQDLGGGIPGLDTLNPYIIDLRNKAAMEVLSQKIADGDKKIAIFYGAAHLPDFERRLISEHGMVRVETRWLNAWDLNKKIAKQNPQVVAMKVLKSLQ